MACRHLANSSSPQLTICMHRNSVQVQTSGQHSMAHAQPLHNMPNVARTDSGMDRAQAAKTGLTVQTPAGAPGRGDTAISATAKPGRSTRRLLREPLPHREYIWGVSSPSRLATCRSLQPSGWASHVHIVHGKLAVSSVQQTTKGMTVGCCPAAPLQAERRRQVSMQHVP